MRPSLPAKRIYLAGGFRSGWQKLAADRLPRFELLDPSLHNIEDPAEYTRWDLNAIQQCDIVLANMEPSNPGGYSLALEVGFAKALAKKIILVDQLASLPVSRHFEMVRQCSDRVFSTLDAALEFLASDP